MGITLSKHKRKQKNFKHVHNPKRRKRDPEKERIYKKYKKVCKLAQSTEVADRLIQHEKTQHPHVNLDWIYDKVIFDLERGR